MVCTVLTGTLLVATLEKTCPPIWNATMGRTPLNNALDGSLSVPIPSCGRVHRKQYSAMNQNWTIVNVIGNLNRL